jgi:hypothetical protein
MVPFANLPKKVKRFLKRSTKGHRVRITPFASSAHHAIGMINPELSVINLDDSSTSFVKIEREHLENAQEIDDEYVAIMIPKQIHEEAVRKIDETVSKKPRKQKKWKNQETLLPRFSVLANVKENKKEKSESRELGELRKFKSQYHSMEGMYIEMMIAGLVPMHRPPPFKFFQMTQLRYGCDFLSYEWRGNVLHLHWIEINLERRNKYPGLTRNELRFKRAVEDGNVVNHYHNTWVDGKGQHHWE